MIEKLPAVKTGIDFLASSHFSIGKEPAWLADSLYESTTMRDYPQRSAARVGLVDLPPRAKIFSKSGDSCEQASVTRCEFVPKPYCRTGYQDASYAQSGTNFKSDRDLRIDSFQTTHNKYYKPAAHAQNGAGKMAHNAAAQLYARNKFEFKTSHIPQGDKEKVKLPPSDYKNNFNGHAAAAAQPGKPAPISCNPTFLSSRNGGGSGDPRSHQHGGQFVTTSGQTFQPAHAPDKVFEIAYATKFPRVYVPNGDPEKSNAMLTTMQASFDRATPYIPIRKTFNRDCALSTIQRTTFRDGDRRLKCFQSTVNDTFIDFVDSRKPPAGKLSRSNCLPWVPEGDYHPVHSAKDRVNLTSNRTEFNKHPDRSYHNQIVDGSQIRTRSNVIFGRKEDRDGRPPSAQAAGNYSTTMTCSFRAHSRARPIRHSTLTSTSRIPLDAPNDSTLHSSYRSDYGTYGNGRLPQLNPIAVEDLKKSHIHEPISDFHAFDTTNQREYAPRPRVCEKFTDTGRLQRSTVPLGTLPLYA